MCPPVCLPPLPSAQQEEKAIAEGVMVRDAWDGSLQDIELEVTGLEFTRQEFTEEQERAAVESAVSSRARGGEEGAGSGAMQLC
jgi:hypothetical protein